MIVFENGEFIGGDLMDIIHFNSYEEDVDNWWDNPLMDECCILEIPKDSTKLKLYEVYKENLHFIPRISDSDDEFYDVFWNSNETYVFECYQYAMKFMENYDGDFKSDINELLSHTIESEIIEETQMKYFNLNDLDKEFDVDFLNELEDFIDSKDLCIDSILTSMKLFMLDKYRLGIQEEILSRLN